MTKICLNSSLMLIDQNIALIREVCEITLEVVIFRETYIYAYR